MPREEISREGQARVHQDDSNIEFYVMEGTPVIKLNAECAEIYGEKIQDAGKLYQEMLDWATYWKMERGYAPLEQTEVRASVRTPRFGQIAVNAAEMWANSYAQDTGMQLTNAPVGYQEIELDELA